MFIVLFILNIIVETLFILKAVNGMAGVDLDKVEDVKVEEGK